MDQGAIERAIGARPARSARIGGGAAGIVERVWLPDGSTVVAKTARSGLDIEGRMLRFLAERSALPVPRVLAESPGLLILEDMPGGPGVGGAAEEHAAELLAALHGIASPDGRYGLEFDGLIGPLKQPNAWSTSWVEFFREHRLLHMTSAAEREGAITAGLARRLESLAERLGELIPDRPPCSLVHGDVWGGNVLCDGGRITAFLDPAVYYAHAEVELAFIELFSTFGSRFFERYRTVHGIETGYRETRRQVYNLYPLLVHARLFGGAYVGQVERIVRSLGY